MEELLIEILDVVAVLVAGLLVGNELAITEQDGIGAGGEQREQHGDVTASGSTEIRDGVCGRASHERRIVRQV